MAPGTSPDEQPIVPSGGSGGGTAGGHGGGGGGAGGTDDPEGPRPSNAITAENDLPGDPDWQGGRGARPGELEGYADRVSARPGDRIPIRVSSDRPLEVGWSLYRIGWYGGAGARLVDSGSLGVVPHQGACPVEAGTGLIRCSWSVAAEIPLPAQALSGLHLIKLVREDGVFHQLPLIVEDGRAAPILFQASVTTWQAYNDWGGASLYVDRVGSTGLGRAVKVGFDRPYLEGYGAGQMLRWEVHFAQFLERYGYDVTYATNLSVDRQLLSGRKVFLSVGHDEYWTLAERDALEAARDAGTSLFFFSANTGYWKIRLEDPDSTGTPRTIVSWKGDVHRDPVKGSDQTGLWRAPPFSRPENRLIGVLYESWMYLSHAWVVADGTHWLYTGTGLATGDTLSRLVGYEYDRTGPGGPNGLQVVARSPVVDILGIPGHAEATVYQAPSGAWVFGSGTIEWSWGLGRQGLADPRVERMTANLLQKAGIDIPPGIGKLPLPEGPLREGSGASSVATLHRNLPVIHSIAPGGGGIVATDPRENRVILVDGTGTWTPVAGGNGPGWITDVPGSQARFNGPTGVAMDRSGNVLVADTGNHCIRIIRPDRTVSDFAGQCGTPGFRDGGAGGSLFTFPMGLAWNAAADELLVADAGNGRIRGIRLGSRDVRTVAGGGFTPVDGPALQTAFAYPTAVASAPDGSLYVVDTQYASIRRVGADGVVRTLVNAAAQPGHQDGPGHLALVAPMGGAAWSNGALLVSEPANFAIRRVLPGDGASSTRVETFAGGRFGNSDGTGHGASFALPLGLSVAGDGSVLVADPGGGTIRQIRP